MAAGEIVFVSVFALFVLGVPGTIAVMAIWMARRTSDKGAVAIQHLTPGQAFELGVPAGPAVTLMLRYAVLSRGTGRPNPFGVALQVELTRGSFALGRQVVIGSDAVSAGSAPSAPAGWVLGAHRSKVDGAHVESSATALIAEVPPGEAFVVRGRLATAPTTQGRGFTLLAKPSK